MAGREHCVYKDFTAGVSGLGIKTTGRTRSVQATNFHRSAAGHKDGPSAFPNFYLDQAYVQLDRASAGLPLKATLGRQHITIGTQFLIGDGVL